MFSKLSKSLRSKKSSSQTSAVDPPILEQSHGSPSRATAPQSLTPHLSPRIDILSSAATQTTAGPAVISEGQNYGIKQLYDGGTDASIDIVFVHGLIGNAYNTWLHKDTKIHWPSALLKQDIPDARVLSFGYDADIVGFWNPASNSRLSNHAENMVGALVRKRERTNTETRRLLFVAHSLGGLVVEYALNHSRSAAEIFLGQIEKYTTGIAFLGVPHFGADLAAWGRFGTSMVNVLRRANQDIVAVLEPGSEILRVTEKTFRNNLSIRKDEGREISITCFYEELPVVGVGEVVPLHSAEMKPYSCYGIHASHMDMTKFPNREDQGYDAILGELQRWKKVAFQEKASKVFEPSTSVKQGRSQFGDTHAWNSQVVQGNFYNANFSTKEGASLEASDQKGNSWWMVPRATTRLYTGRKKLGERLAQVFESDPISPSFQKIFVIIGIGGTGKSEVCLKFAEAHRDEYWGVFWLDATSVGTASQGYIDIGRRCGVFEPNVENVKSWLACKSEYWLLIIDNADDPELNYSQYIPHSNRGDILFSTRNPECGEHKTVGSEDLEELEPELAQDLLLLATGIEQYRWKDKRRAALAIVEILGSHTLAIIQAGAFIKKKLCTIEQYPAIFQQQKGQLLKFYSKQNASIYRNVYATFDVSAKYLEKSKLPEALDAVNLLHILAFFYNSEISEVIFLRAAQYASQIRDEDLDDQGKIYSLSTNHISRFPEYAQGQSDLQNRLRWRKACSVLESLSIIVIRAEDVDDDEEHSSFTVSMHSLIHVWAKERQDFQSQSKAWQSASTVIAFSCQGWYEYCPFFMLLQPHVRACVNHNKEGYTQQISEMETAQILFQLACVLYKMRDDKSLDLLISQTRSRLQDTTKENIIIQIDIFTGRVLEQQGDYGTAVQIYKAVTKRQTLALTDDHPDRLASQRALAGAYEANGQVEEAVQLLKHVVQVQEKLAHDHPSRLASQHALAVAYRANGQIEEAVQLLEHVVQVQEKLADNHSSRLASQHALALAYQANGQIEEAVQLLEHVVQVKEKLADNHPSRLASQHVLAGAYQASGQVEEAVQLLEHVVQVEEKLADDHPSRLASQHALAMAYQANGQIEEAVQLLKHVVQVEEKLIDDHPDRLASKHALVNAYQANGQIKEAVQLLEHVVQVEEKLADDHPSRLVSQRDLANAYRANGQVEEAVQLLEYVVHIQEKLADNHPSRLASQRDLANAYRANGQVEEAVQVREKLVNNNTQVIE